MGKKLFKNTSPELYFKLLDGSELKNVHELTTSLKTMSEDVFHSHVTQDSNDFSNWVRDIFHEHELANKLNDCKSIQETELCLLRHLVGQKAK